MKIASTSRRFISPLIALTRASVIRLPAVGSNVFAISLSSAARQPKGRGYSRKPRSGHRPPDRKSSSQKLDCRALPSSFSRAKGGRVFTIAVVSIRRRLPLDSRHVRGNASACSRFFSLLHSPPPLLVRFRSRKLFPRLEHAVPIAFPTPARRKRWLCWARDEIDRRCNRRCRDPRFETYIYIYPNLYFSYSPDRNGSGKICDRYLEPARDRYRYGRRIDVYAVGERFES